MKPVVFVASADARDGSWLAQCLGGDVELLGATRGDQALVGLGQGPVAAIVVGRTLVDGPSDRLLAALAEVTVPIFWLGAPAEATPAVWGCLNHRFAAHDVRALVLSAIARRPMLASAAQRLPANADEARRHAGALDATRRLAVTSELVAAEHACRDAIIEYVAADRGHCLFVDASSGSVWSQAEVERAGDNRRAIAGLVGFAARTGGAASCERASTNPRYLRALDDPDGRGPERIAVQPVLGNDGEVHAVLVAVRTVARPAFTDDNRARFAALAGHAGPLLERLSTRAEAESLLAAEAEAGMFRAEAVASHAGARHGDVVRVAPAWIGKAYWLVGALVIASIVYCAIGRVATYSRGVAVIRAVGRQDVNARAAGNIVAVAVAAGQPVAAGDILARLDDAEPAAAVDRLERELEAQLRSRLLDPGDVAAGQAVRSLRLQLEQARSALEERLVRAPQAGVIRDVRVEPGSRVAPGDLVATITDDDGALELVALLPGADRPQLAPGMRLRLEIAGYRYAYQDLTIAAVSDEVIGPTEARRVLGPQVADAIPVGGSVVIVRAKVAGTSFVADGETFRYHDGMAAGVEVEVRSEPILVALIPGLKRL